MTYQGWANRETWLIALWLNNEQALQEEAKTICNSDAEMEPEAAESLRDWVDDLVDMQIGDKRTGFIADMLSDYLELVNWTEIARSFRAEAGLA